MSKPEDVYRRAVSDLSLRSRTGFVKRDKAKLRRALQDFPQIAAVSVWPTEKGYVYRLHELEVAEAMANLQEAGYIFQAPPLLNFYTRDQLEDMVESGVKFGEEHEGIDTDLSMLDDL